MAADLGISIAEKLFETIGSEIIKEVCDMWGYKSQLDDLKETVSTIRKVLLDAEAKRELSYEEQNFIEKLKDAVYDADDLFDEFLTLAELKQLMKPLSKHDEFFAKKERGERETTQRLARMLSGPPAYLQVIGAPSICPVVISLDDEASAILMPLQVISRCLLWISWFSTKDR